MTGAKTDREASHHLSLHPDSGEGSDKDTMLQLDTRKLILVKADVSQYSGDSESDSEKLVFDGAGHVSRFIEVQNTKDDGLSSFECQMEPGRPGGGLGQHHQLQQQQLQPGQEKGGRKMRPFGCDICRKMFTRIEILRRHLKTHMEDKDFKCTYCSKAFDRKDVLNDHMRNHTGEKPFQCTICHKKFTRGFVLLRHMRTHGEGLFKCKYCLKSFDRKDTYRDHLRNHTGERPFKCKFCPKSFSRSFVLTKHEKGHEMKEGEEVIEEENESDTETHHLGVDMMEEIEYEDTAAKDATDILLQKEFPQDTVEQEEVIEDDFDIIQDGVLGSDSLISEPVVEEVVETEAITLATADGQIVRVISKEQYDRLLQVANKQKTYRCDTCNKTFTSASTFQQHYSLQWEAGGCIASAK